MTRPERTPIDAGGAAAAGLTAVLYGSSYVATAIALRGFTPVTAAMWRGVIAGLALTVLLLVWRSPALHPGRLTGARARRLLILAALNGPAFILTMNLAVSLAGASITAFVAGLYAVLSAVFAIPVLGERPERTTLAALLLALVGAALLGQVGLGGETALGVGIGFVAAIIFAAFLVLSRRWSVAYRLPGPTVALTAVTLTALAALVLAGASGAVLPSSAPGADAVAAVAWLGLAVGAVATVLVVVSMRRLHTHRVAAFLLLNPPTATILAWLLLGERFSGLQFLGAALVLVAMAAASGIRPWAGPG